MSDWDNYSENLAFDPANSMPRCDIEELKEKVKKLENKLRIATKALEFYSRIENICRKETIDVYYEDKDCHWATVDGAVENGYKARQALAKIKE